MADNPERPPEPPAPSLSPPGAPSAPWVADDRDHRLDPRSVTVSRIAASITLAIIAFIQLVGVLMAVLLGSMPLWVKLLILGAWLALAACMAVWTWLWPPLRYRHASSWLRKRTTVDRP